MSSPTTPLSSYPNARPWGSANETLAGLSPNEAAPIVSRPQHFAVMTNAHGSPSTITTSTQDQQKLTKVHGLIGFDPLLSTSFKKPVSLTLASYPVSSDCEQALSSRISAPSQPITPKITLAIESRNEKNRREKHSFLFDQRSITKNAAAEGLPEQRSTSQERTHFKDQREAQTAPTPKRIFDRNISTKHQSPKTHNRRDLFTISITPKEEKSRSLAATKSTGEDGVDVCKSKKEGKPGPGATLKLPWQKMKGHHRTKSLETSKDLSVSKLERNSESVPHHAMSEVSQSKSTSMYNGMVKDLMELSFDKLQLPTLAKPSPTSFLTGHDDEVLRTCEYEAAPFQMEIPSLPEFVVAARLNEFVENYRRMDQNLDLQDWKGMTNKDLQKVTIAQHIPIAQLLIDCGEDLSIEGVIAVGSSADNRVEAIILKGQQNFVVVVRASTEQQLKPCPKKTTNRKAVPIDAEHEHVDVYQCFLEEYLKVESECLAQLDNLTEAHPFCDVTFTGYSFGAALSTLGAVRYSNARPMMRVNNYPMGSPKVGFSEFRRMVNSSPNLRVMRLELGQDGKCQLPGQGGSHVGHTLVLNGSLGNNSLKTSSEPVLAYKFGAPKHKKFKTTYPDLRSYVVALEEIARLKLQWAHDFVGTAGEGVVINNEARQMV